MRTERFSVAGPASSVPAASRSRVPSTSYGLRAMLLLEDSLAPDLIPVAEYVRQCGSAAGLAVDTLREHK